MDLHQLQGKALELDQLARGLEVPQETYERIKAEVDAMARQSTTWGTLEQRLAEIRTRLIQAAQDRDALDRVAQIVDQSEARTRDPGFPKC